jgi:hypothetical protein
LIFIISNLLEHLLCDFLNRIFMLLWLEVNLYDQAIVKLIIILKIVIFEEATVYSWFHVTFICCCLLEDDE